MRSLFLRIFLWFWLALILVNVGVFFSFVLTRPEMPGPHWHRPPLGKYIMDIYAQTSAEIFERQGKPALAAYLNRLEEATNMRAVLFNERGEELSGRNIPSGAEALAKQVRADGPPEFSSVGEIRLGAQRAETLEGGKYTMVAELPSWEDHTRRLFFRTQAPRFLISILIGGLLCYWLARFLTRPVIQLRAATQELAAGNLGVRVSPKLIKHGGELAHLGNDFNRMAERIQAMVNAQRRLLGDISHELRSPLTRLILALEIARKRAGDTKAAALAHDRIELEAASLNEMISQLLTLTKMEESPETLRTEEVNLPALLSTIVDDADFEARGNNRTVRLLRSEECTTIGRPELLHSAIENVVRNAVRYTPEGSEVEVSLECYEDSGKRFALIKVRDYGPGVIKEVQEAIFLPFYRVADDRDRQSGGTGLGLAITARAVRSHGGEVKATNASDGGLLVEIRLPVTANIAAYLPGQRISG